MSISIKTFDKLIDAKEREKQNILNHYHTLQERFEKHNNLLLELLQKEDRAKKNLGELIQKGIASDIQKQSQYIQCLQPLIKKQEAFLKQSKDELHIEKLKLIKKNVEKKKYEKVREKKVENIRQLEKQKETKNMDDISLRQFMKSKVMT